MMTSLLLLLGSAVSYAAIADFSSLELSEGASVVYQAYEGSCEVEDDYYHGSYSYNPAFPSKPMAVVRVATKEDVVAAVKFFNEHALPFRIRASGHNLAGYSGAACSQYLIDTSLLDTMERSADGLSTFGPGVRSDQVFKFLLPHREVIVSCAPSVHMSGMVLVGGISELSTVQGLTTDLAKSIDLVTFDGEEVTASETENPELFYALRGAGAGNFGVITGVTIQGIPVPSEMGKGTYVFGGDDAGIKAFMGAYRDEIVLSDAGGVPLEMGVYLTLVSSAAGRTFLLDWTYFGDDMAEGMEMLEAWVQKTAEATSMTVADSSVNSTTYEDYVRFYEPKVGPTNQAEDWLSPFQTNFDDTYIDMMFAESDKLVAAGGNSAIALLLAEQVNGGEAGMAQTGSSETSAFPYRDTKFWWIDITSCPFDNTGPCSDFVSSVYEATKAADGYLGLYAGIQTRTIEEGGAFLDDYYMKDRNPESWSRLMAVKDEFDPNNVFCYPQSLVPCSPPTADQCSSRGPVPAPEEGEATPAGPGEVCESDVGCVEGFHCHCMQVPSGASARRLLFGGGDAGKTLCYCHAM